MEDPTPNISWQHWSAEEIEREQAKIRASSQEELAREYRFAKSGHPWFDSGLPFWAVFQECFKGWTPELSKRIGWNKPGHQD